MGKVKHIIKVGDKFNKLTVLELLPESKIKCVCDCGNEKIIIKSKLVSGHTKSCGCSYNKHTINVGDKFNKLTVLEILPKSKIRCICDCGNEKIIDKYKLIFRHTKSCGCLYIKHPINVGDIFGKLTVLEILPKSKIRCICDCGNEKIIIRDILIFCNIKNCGCSTKEIRETTILKKYGTKNTFQNEEIKKKIKQTNIERYGVDNPSKSEEIYQKTKETNLEKYGTEHYSSSNEFKERKEEFKQKSKDTCIERYGVENVFQKEEFRKKSKDTCIERYGVEYAIQNAEIARNNFKNRDIIPKYVQNIAIKLKELNIKFDIESPQKNGVYQKCWDLLIYKDNEPHILIDCDGLYFHSLTNDTFYKHQLNNYPLDQKRYLSIPNNLISIIIIEGDEENGVKLILKALNLTVEDFYEEMYNNCTNMNFPYPEYSNKRMLKDYEHLNEVNLENYNKRMRSGSSIIYHFCKSLYNIPCKGISPIELWNNKGLLKDKIFSHQIYIDDNKHTYNRIYETITTQIIQPSYIKYLIMKYGDNPNNIINTFISSSCLLASSSLNLQYFTPNLTDECKDIINFLKLDNIKENKEYDLSYNEVNNDEEILSILNSRISKIYLFIISTTNFTENIVEYYEDKIVLKF